MAGIGVGGVGEDSFDRGSIGEEIQVDDLSGGEGILVEKDAKGVILSGSPFSVYDTNAPDIDFDAIIKSSNDQITKLIKHLNKKTKWLKT